MREMRIRKLSKLPGRKGRVWLEQLRLQVQCSLSLTHCPTASPKSSQRSPSFLPMPRCWTKRELGEKGNERDDIFRGKVVFQKKKKKRAFYPPSICRWSKARKRIHGEMMGVGYGTAHFCLQIRISSDFFLSSDVCALAENDVVFFF